MRHWIMQQPGGQGLASEFHAYFRELSIDAREVRSAANTHKTVLITLCSTHSLSRKNHILPKAQW